LFLVDRATGIVSPEALVPVDSGGSGGLEDGDWIGKRDLLAVEFLLVDWGYNLSGWGLKGEYGNRGEEEWLTERVLQ
jgi:hypothetical protein